MEGLTAGWVVDRPIPYLLTVFACAAAIRIVHGALRAVRLTADAGGGWRVFVATFKRILWGFPAANSGASGSTVAPAAVGGAPDYFTTFIIGSFELAAYPVLMATGAWTVIGAWMGLKTAAQWREWSRDRTVFHMFLIGNLMVIATAALVLPGFVKAAQRLEPAPVLVTMDRP